MSISFQQILPPTSKLIRHQHQSHLQSTTGRMSAYVDWGINIIILIIPSWIGRRIYYCYYYKNNDEYYYYSVWWWVVLVQWYGLGFLLSCLQLFLYFDCSNTLANSLRSIQHLSSILVASFSGYKKYKTYFEET